MRVATFNIFHGPTVDHTRGRRGWPPPARRNPARRPIASPAVTFSGDQLAGVAVAADFVSTDLATKRNSRVLSADAAPTSEYGGDVREGSASKAAYWPRVGSFRYFAADDRWEWS